jgi:hypothetical protein
MALITRIGVHNSGSLGNDPYSKSGHLTVEQINNAHKARDFNLSEMGYYVGYTFLLFPDGTLKQTRLVGEQTCAAKGANFDTVHICMLGNFNRGSGEQPTQAQKEKLVWLIKGLEKGDLMSMGIKMAKGLSYTFSRERVYPHRVLQPNHTDCYGNSLSDTWIKELVQGEPLVTNDIEDLKKELLLLIERLRALYKKRILGQQILSCSDVEVRDSS